MFRSSSARLERLLCLVSAVLLTAADPIAFEDIGPRSGVDFRFVNGSKGAHDLPEIMGGGVALIDVDNDGKLDLYFCQGGPIADGVADDSPCRLYRNLGNGRFADQTANAGAPGPSFAMGAAVGDFDNDGLDDLFVTGWRDQRLYRNLGGRFEDVTKRANLISTLWSASAAWADLDADGDLDLMVVNYLDYQVKNAPYCAAADGRRDYCGPEDFAGQRDRLYRNNGDATFTDVTGEAGIDPKSRRGLGVIVCDLVGDRRPDIYVANDGDPGCLYENLGGLRFREVGEAAGVALDGSGEPISGMGLAAGDLSGSGRTDLLVTNFYKRSTIAFQSLGNGLYRDGSTELGLKSLTRDVLGFGVVLIDFDHDGRLDLVQANGHVQDRERLRTPFAMPSTIAGNVNGRFADASETAGAWFAKKVLGRGLATGDLDGDGRLDLVIASLDTPPALLFNKSRAQVCQVALSGKKGGQAFGSRLLAVQGNRRYLRDLPGGGSYLSSSQRVIGLPRSGAEPWTFEVTWPSGKTEHWRHVNSAQTIRLKEGTGD